MEWFAIAVAFVWLALLTVQTTRVRNGLEATYRHLTTRGGNRD